MSALLDGLARFERRAALQRAVAAGVPAVVATLGVSECLRAVIWRQAGHDATLATAVAAGALAALAGWRRRPAMARVARAVDAVTTRQATVATALDTRSDADLFAARVRARAAEVLQATRPGQVYPLRVGRAGQAVILLGLALIAASRLAPGPGSDAPPPSPGVSSSGGPRQTVPPAATRPGATARGSAGAPRAARPPATGTPPQPAAAAATGRSLPPPATDAQEPGRLDGVLGRTGKSDGRSAARALPGGGRSGRGQTAAGATDAVMRGDRGGRAAGPPIAAPGLERVPMNRRAYVRQYLLSLDGPEPR